MCNICHLTKKYFSFRNRWHPFKGFLHLLFTYLVFTHSKTILSLTWQHFTLGLEIELLFPQIQLFFVPVRNLVLVILVLFLLRQAKQLACPVQCLQPFMFCSLYHMLHFSWSADYYSSVCSEEVLDVNLFVQVPASLNGNNLFSTSWWNLPFAEKKLMWKTKKFTQITVWGGGSNPKSHINWLHWYRLENKS